jgi:Uma2 family endonuclease
MPTTTAAATSGLVKVRFTTDDFHRMDEAGLLDGDSSYELLDGEVFLMSPESYEHASRSARLAGLFRQRIRDMGLDPVDHVREGHPVVLSDYTEPEPDVTLLRGEPGRTPRPEDLRLVVEVSRTTYATDRRTKLPLYARAGVPEVWIVRIEPETPRVLEVYRQPEGEGYATALTPAPDGTVEVEAWPNLGAFAVSDVLG